MGKFKQFLNEDKNTDFMETASCIGIVCGSSLSNRLKKFLDSGDGDVTSLLKEVQSIAGSGGYDWNATGVKVVKSLKADQKGAAQVNVCFNLVVGMNIFMQDIGYGIVGTKPYFIHNKIKDYYEAEKEVFGKIPYTKNNTSDCIISDVNHDTLLKDILKGATPDSASKYMISAGGYKYIQASLKKDDASAQLGKITSMVKGMYDITDTKNAAKMFTNEGVWDNMWSKVKEFAGKIKSFVSGYVKQVMGKFGKINTKHLTDFERAMGVSEKVSKSGKEFSGANQALINSILNNPSKATMLVNIEFTNLQNVAKVVGVPVVGKQVKNLSVKEPGDVFKIVSNYLTLKTAQEIVSDSSKMQKNINRLVTEMFFGGTKLPLWKVFGYFGTKAYHYMGTLEVFEKRELPDVGCFGVKITSAGSSYTITFYMLEDVVDNGKSYVQLRTGTNSSSQITFIVEGVKKIGPFPLEKSLEEIIQ